MSAHWSAILLRELRCGRETWGQQTMIEIEYIVKDSKGAERLRTTDKKEADAYDRILENAERLAGRLRADQVLPTLPEADLEELTIYLARNARDVERILRGKLLSPETPAGDASLSLKKDKVAPLKATGS
jgi:dsDNA-binding SOS-regulon protein